MQVHGLEADVRHDQGCADPSRRANGTEQIGPGEAAITLDARAGSPFGPDAGQRVLLADARFILEPNFDGPAGKRLWDRGVGEGSEIFLRNNHAGEGSLCKA